MKQYSFLAVFCLSVFFAKAQTEPCKVLADSLVGTYEGGCSKGKANGEGKAVGAHTYTGNFKNGLPDGKGKYTWKNGNYYWGDWKKGIKEGKGEMHTFSANNEEKVVEGYWRKDIYRGEHKDPYIIHNKTSDVGRVEVSRVGDVKENQLGTIEVSVESMINTGNTMNGGTVARITDERVSTGSYMSKASNLLTNKELTIYKQVIFPIRFYWSVGNAIVEVEFFEPGNYTVNIPITR